MAYFEEAEYCNQHCRSWGEQGS